MIFDLHFDLECYLTEHRALKQRFHSLKRRDIKRHGDIPQFKASGYKLFVANIFPFTKNGKGRYQYRPLEFPELISKISRFKDWISEYDEFELIFTKKDLSQILKKKDKFGIILGIEGLDFLKDISELDKLYNLGVRCFGLNWRDDSNLSGSSTGNKKFGLTKFGKEVVRYLGSLKCILDLAHASEASIAETEKIYPSSVIFSHTGVWEVYKTKRNVKFALANRFRDRGFLMGICLVEDSIAKSGEINFKKWYRHISYLEEKGEVAAIGTDFFGTWFNRSIPEFRNAEGFGRILRANNVHPDILFRRAYNLFMKNLP